MNIGSPIDGLDVLLWAAIVACALAAVALRDRFDREQEARREEALRAEVFPGGAEIRAAAEREQRRRRAEAFRRALDLPPAELDGVPSLIERTVA